MVEDKFIIRIEKSKPRIPRKPKGGGLHKDRRTKRKRTRNSVKQEYMEDWDNYGV